MLQKGDIPQAPGSANIKMQYGNYRVVSQQQSNVSPIMTSGKLSVPSAKLTYSSVNVSQNTEAGTRVTGLLNVSNEGGGGAGSGSSTPNHLSQQNLIKIMKKIKSSNP